MEREASSPPVVDLVALVPVGCFVFLVMSCWANRHHYSLPRQAAIAIAVGFFLIANSLQLFGTPSDLEESLNNVDIGFSIPPPPSITTAAPTNVGSAVPSARSSEGEPQTGPTLPFYWGHPHLCLPPPMILPDIRSAATHTGSGPTELLTSSRQLLLRTAQHINIPTMPTCASSPLPHQETGWASCRSCGHPREWPWRR